MPNANGNLRGYWTTSRGEQGERVNTRDTGAQHIFHDIEDALHDAFRAPKILPGRRVASRSSRVQRCPVCDGRGNVPAGFYGGPYNQSASATGPEQCRSCDGSGMVIV